jgi:predicted O-methyltransferase YrrM
MATGYAIAGGLAGKRRLDVLARVMAPATVSLLDQIGIREGDRCVDVGCGGGNVTRELARRVGDQGSVIGLDLDDALLELAAAELTAAGITNVEFRCHDAAHLEDADYDLAYARLLLSHVSDPAGVAAAMVASIKPGGVVAVEDLDFDGYSCYPPCAAHDRWVEIYRETIHRRGGNHHLGPALPALLQTSGVQDIGVAVSQPCSLQGDAKLCAPMALEAMTDVVVSEGVASADEVSHIVAVLYQRAADPTTLMGLPRIVQAWGTTPNAASTSNGAASA